MKSILILTQFLAQKRELFLYLHCWGKWQPCSLHPLKITLLKIFFLRCMWNVLGGNCNLAQVPQPILKEKYYGRQEEDRVGDGCIHISPFKQWAASERGSCRPSSRRSTFLFRSRLRGRGPLQFGFPNKSIKSKAK